MSVLNVDTYGTCKEGMTEEKLVEIINKNFDLRPGCIIRDLELTKPKFMVTSAYGHFGRDGESFTWEQPKSLTF